MDYREIMQAQLDYIEENLKTELRPPELAARAGFSLYHFYRLFQAATGLPVMQYILRRRLLHAIHAIGRGATGIQAALDYGFDTYAGFYRAFRREFGCTPARYLQSCSAPRPGRLNLMKEEHMIVTRKKAAQLLRHWNMETEPVLEIHYPGTGRKNENAYYVGTGCVLKFTANPGKLRTHITLARALEDLGLPAATAVTSREGADFVQEGDQYFFLTRRIPGTHPDPAALYDMPDTVRSLGQALGRLHLALKEADCCVNDADTLETVTTWALPAASGLLGPMASHCRGFLDTFTRLYPQLPRQIIHRDPNPGNLLLDGSRWGFIDFDLSEQNARIYDPCYAATAILSEAFRDPHCRDRWPDLCRSLFQGYSSVTPLTEAEKQAIPCLILANQLICLAWFAQQESYPELLETNRQMTLWLLEQFRDTVASR